MAPNAIPVKTKKTPMESEAPGTPAPSSPGPPPSPPARRAVEEVGGSPLTKGREEEGPVLEVWVGTSGPPA